MLRWRLEAERPAPSPDEEPPRGGRVLEHYRDLRAGLAGRPAPQRDAERSAEAPTRAGEPRVERLRAEADALEDEVRQRRLVPDRKRALASRGAR